jgi:hypothetical protein
VEKTQKKCISVHWAYDVLFSKNRWKWNIYILLVKSKDAIFSKIWNLPDMIITYMLFFQAETEDLAKRVELLTAENTSLKREINRLTESCKKLSSENSALMVLPYLDDVITDLSMPCHITFSSSVHLILLKPLSYCRWNWRTPRQIKGWKYLQTKRLNNQLALSKISCQWSTPLPHQGVVGTWDKALPSFVNSWVLAWPPML